MNRKLKNLYRHRNGIVRRLRERETPEDQAALERVDAEIDAIEEHLYGLYRERKWLIFVLKCRCFRLALADATARGVRYRASTASERPTSAPASS